MLILRDPEDSRCIANPDLRKLIDLRFDQLGHFHDGLLIVVEIGDSVEELKAVSGFVLLHDPFEDVPFGHPDFTPAFDYMEAHQDDSGRTYCFEAHADTGDDGLGITLFIPAEEGIPASLLAMCARYATPAAALMEP
jgi:hypothetical protein